MIRLRHAKRRTTVRPPFSRTTTTKEDGGEGGGVASAEEDDYLTKEEKQQEAESKFRLLQSKRQAMTNISCELGVTIFIAYLVISLNGINQECAPNVHRDCIDFYLLNNGSAVSEFIQSSCSDLRKSCSESGLFSHANSNLELALREDPTNATLAGIKNGIYSKYFEEILFCFCLLHDITFNETTGALLTVSDASFGHDDCNFTMTRGVFFIMGVILVALMEGSTMAQEKSSHSWENFLEIFGRVIAVIMSVGYFFGVIFYFQKSTNPNLECRASKFYEIADICTVMGIISLVAVCVFVFTFEISVLADSIKHMWQEYKASHSVVPAPSSSSMNDLIELSKKPQTSHQNLSHHNVDKNNQNVEVAETALRSGTEANEYSDDLQNQNNVVTLFDKKNAFTDDEYITVKES